MLSDISGRMMGIPVGWWALLCFQQVGQAVGMSGDQPKVKACQWVII